MIEQPLPARKSSPWNDWDEAERRVAETIIAAWRRHDGHRLTLEFRISRDQPPQVFVAHRESLPLHHT